MLFLKYFNVHEELLFSASVINAGSGETIDNAANRQCVGNKYYPMDIEHGFQARSKRFVIASFYSLDQQ